MKITHLTIGMMVLGTAGAGAFAPAAVPATQPTSSIPSANTVLDRLLPVTAPAALRPEASATTTRPAAGADAGAVAPAARRMILREGSFIVDRVGRLTHTPDGRLQFAFTADGQTLQDAPVGLLPNLTLMQMENAAARGNSYFRITGEVTEYKGHNYVLLEKFIVLSESAQVLP